jgi:hypothetical protein
VSRDKPPEPLTTHDPDGLTIAADRQGGETVPARRGGANANGGDTRRGHDGPAGAATLIASTRPPVDRVEHPATHAAVDRPELTAAQRSEIYAAVSKDRSKTSPQRFPVAIGAEVPPMINLYALPDDIVAGIPAAKLYECTMVEDKVVLVDPTRMRVVDTIGPQPQQ